MAEENKLRTSAGLSSLWDGEPIHRVRAGDGVVMLPGRRCTVHLMVQPDVAAVMLGDPLLLNQGFLSRMLVTAPESTAGKRMWREPAPDSNGKIQAYGAKVLSVLEMPMPMTAGKNNELQPRPLPLSADAREAWIKYVDHLEGQMGAGGTLEAIRGLANKAPEHAARIAAVLNFFYHPSIGEVDVFSMSAGIEIIEHYLQEALRLFGAPKVDQDLRLAQKLLHWLQTSWEGSLVSLPDIYQRGLNAIGDKKTATRIVTILEAHGWLVRLEEAHFVMGEKRREVWQIVRG